jgi:hypothetical protein
MLSEASILVCWSARREIVEACAARLAQTMEELRAVSPAFSPWSDVKRNKQFIEIDSDVGALARLLDASRQKTDARPVRVIDELGFSICLRTNESAREYLVLQVRCGSYCKDVPNRCIIDFAERGPKSYGSLDDALKAAALRALVRNWDPDSGAICNWSFHLAMEAKCPNYKLGELGWITYVPYRRGPLPGEARRSFEVEELPLLGHLIYLGKARPKDETGDDYLKAAFSLYQALERHNIVGHQIRKV